MLRIKHKKISVQFITLAVLCLCYGLMIYLSLAPAYAAALPPQPSYYVVDAYQTPGAVYKIVNRTPRPFFRRRLGSISSIALWRGQLYFCSANDKRIYQKRTGQQQERVVFEHRTYIRDVAVDPSGYLYFSEASGAKGDGRIYKLSPRVNELEDDGHFSIATDSQSRPVQVQVRLSTVDKFWAGDFTFDEQGNNAQGNNAQGNLYLSSGNHIPAFIYRVKIEKGSQYGSPRKIYKDSRGAIKGIAIDPNDPDFIYYADWKQTIYKLNIRNSRRIRAFSGSIARSRNQHLSDIAFNIRRP